jgi:hypothetical protein
VELGIGAPSQGLYLREDVELRCNVVLASFVKKTVKKCHTTLIERVKAQSELAAAAGYRAAVVGDALAEQRMLGYLSLESDSRYSSSSSPPPPAYQAQLAYPKTPRDWKGGHHGELKAPVVQLERHSAPPIVEPYAAPPPADSPWMTYSSQAHPDSLRPGSGSAQANMHMRPRSVHNVPKLRLQTPGSPIHGLPVQSRLQAQQPSMYPAPLRLRHSSVASVVTAGSLVSTAAQPQAHYHQQPESWRQQQTQQIQQTPPRRRSRPQLKTTNPAQGSHKCNKLRWWLRSYQPDTRHCTRTSTQTIRR